MTLCGLSCLSKSEEQSDRKDGQRTGQLDDRRVIQRVCHGMHSIPCRSSSRHRRSVIDGSTGKQTKSFIRKVKQRTKCRKDQSRDHIEQKDDGYRLCDFLILCLNDRRSCGNGRTHGIEEPTPIKVAIFVGILAIL